MYFNGSLAQSQMQIRCKLQTDDYGTYASGGDLTLFLRDSYSQSPSRETLELLVLDGHFTDAFFLDNRVEMDFARRRTVQARTGTEAFAERGWDEEVAGLALESLRSRLIAQSVTGAR